MEQQKVTRLFVSLPPFFCSIKSFQFSPRVLTCAATAISVFVYFALPKNKNLHWIFRGK